MKYKINDKVVLKNEFYNIIQREWGNSINKVQTIKKCIDKDGLGEHCYYKTNQLNYLYEDDIEGIVRKEGEKFN